jgi:hypothetical protein
MQQDPSCPYHHVWEAAMISIDEFRRGLLAQLDRAALGGRINVLINSRELHHSLGGCPGSTDGMPSCFEAMQAEMKFGDNLLFDQTSTIGMTVRYLLPRIN